MARSVRLISESAERGSEPSFDFLFNDLAWSVQCQVLNGRSNIEAGVVPVVVPAMDSEGRVKPGLATAAESCPACGMAREDWPDPQGFAKEGRTYCCQGCADGTGCTCQSKTKKELR